MEKKVFGGLPPIYHYKDGLIVYISPSKKIYTNKKNKLLLFLLSKAIKNGHIAEFELVAINRYLIGKDAAIDLNCSHSQMQRKIQLGKELYELLLSK